MNDNEREALVNELFEQVDARAHDIYLLGYNHEGISDSRNRVEQIITLVEQDVARRLLSEDVVEAFTADFCNEVEERHHPRWVYDVACGVVETALAAAGITPGDAREGGDEAV